MRQLSDQQWNVYHDFHLSVRYGEVGSNGEATLASLANWLQEAAGQSASSFGFGEEAMSPLSLGWILTRLVLRIRRLPAPGEAIRVRTWPSLLDRFGHRGYELYDGDNTLIVSGGSAWSVMDMVNRALVALPTGLAANYPPQAPACDPFTCRVLPRLDNALPTRQTPIRVRHDDLDLNGHVNNARYLSWLMEPLPESAFRSMHQAQTGSKPALRLVDITFRSECFPGEELASLCATADAAEPVTIFDELAAPHKLIHTIRATRSHDGHEKMDDVCRAITLWSDKPF